MKKTSTLAVLMAFLFLFQSCKKEDLEKPYPLPNVEGCLPANPFYGPSRYWGVDVSSDLVKAVVTAAGKTIEDVSSINFNKGKVIITTPGLSFDEIQSASVWIRPKSSDPITETNKGVQLAYTESFTAGAQSADLTLTGTDILSQIKSNAETQLILEVLNKDKTATGGTPEICVKLVDASLQLKIKQ